MTQNDDGKVNSKRKIRLTAFQKIIIGFAGVILVGALLLMLPIASADGTVTPFGDTLFTSTSAVCVTGLVVRDTATHWSGFGQAIIFILIQIGGLGVVTVGAAFALLSGRRISIVQRSTMQEAISAPKLGGIVRLTLFILIMTLIFEFTGAAVMMPEFIRFYGPKGIWMSVFHSVSAFCNAGFDIMGGESGQFSSLTAMRTNPLVNVTVMLLIIIGGIGFMTWDDVRENKFHARKWRMQTKVVLVTSAVLIIVPAIFFFIFEFAGLPPFERIIVSLFQAVTPRTAGFNTVDLNAFSGAGKTIMIILMLIGGSPGSTAGGMKTTTAALLVANMIAVFRRSDEPAFFGRRVDSSVNKSAGAILMLYLSLFLSGAAVISTVENLPIDVCLFETASAVGTVGLTLGITPALGTASRIILMILMFLGRAGGLTIIYAAVSDRKGKNSRFPVEKLTVG